MAAAARLNEPDPALEKIRNTLSALRSECRSPSGLEEKIDHIRVVDMKALAESVGEYADTLLEPASQAASLILEDLEYAVDAFHDYVRHRADHEDYEHVIGRAEVTRYLRNYLDKAIDHFGKKLP